MHAMSMPKPLCSVLIVIVSLLFFLLCTDAIGSYKKSTLHPDAYSVTELETLIEEYQSQVKVLNGQIKVIEKDLDWLLLKMDRISDSGRKVSYQLKKSVGSKQKRVSILRIEKRRLEDLVIKLESKHSTKKQKTAVTKPEAQIKQVAIKSKPIIPPASPKVTETSLIAGKKTAIEAAVKKAGLEDWVEVTNADGGCAKVKNTLPILFSSGSASLAKEYQPFLKKLASLLKSYDVKVYVNGYADPDPIKTKKYPSNFELGASRAANIVHELVKYGLKPDIFKIGTTGEYRFAAKQPFTKKTFQRQALVTVVFNG
jgi:chemotaxis protein MotB